MSSVNDASDGLPYRPCVGALVFNDSGHVFVGKRSSMERQPYVWQMPQGGIDEGEEPEQAAFRELEEETSIRSVDLLAESVDWLSYDLPPEALGRWRGRYRGQTQKWFAFRFTGKEAEINLNAHQPAEFSEWKWVPLAEITDLVVPFKLPVYEALVREFSHFADGS